MARQCLTYGCLYPAVAGRSRCSRCGPSNPARHGPNPYGYAHQKDAARVVTPGARCWICGGLASPTDPLQADHVIPLSMGGQATLSNLRPAHRSCNIRKGGRNRLR
ncbi:MAG TPA: HNH endonuclease signature motif containing protein [Chloroflexota bacterium]